jgi:hypothetical protein
MGESVLFKTSTKVIHKLITRKVNGACNVVGDARILRFEFFGLRLAEEFNLDKRLINSGSLTDKIYLVRHPQDISLSNRKVYQFLRRKLSGVGENIAGFRGRESDGLARRILAI